MRASSSFLLSAFSASVFFFSRACNSSIQTHITGSAVDNVNSGPWLSTCAEQAVQDVYLGVHGEAQDSIYAPHPERLTRSIMRSWPLCSNGRRLQLPAAELQSRWTVDRLDTSNPRILYSQRAAWLLQASVFVQYTCNVHLPARSSCSVFENLYCGFKHKNVCLA